MTGCSDGSAESITEYTCFSLCFGQSAPVWPFSLHTKQSPSANQRARSSLSNFFNLVDGGLSGSVREIGSLISGRMIQRHSVEEWKINVEEAICYLRSDCYFKVSLALNPTKMRRNIFSNTKHNIVLRWILKYCDDWIAGSWNLVTFMPPTRSVVAVSRAGYCSPNHPHSKVPKHDTGLLAQGSPITARLESYITWLLAFAMPGRSIVRPLSNSALWFIGSYISAAWAVRLVRHPDRRGSSSINSDCSHLAGIWANPTLIGINE